MRSESMWAIGIVICLWTGLAGGEPQRVILRGGAEIQADVLKADSEAVILDLGTTVLRVPRGDVLRLEPIAEQTDANDANAPDAVGDKWQLYRTADLKPMTIEKAARRFSEAVVMVSTPNGQGSGFVINADGYLITNYHVIAQETRIKITVFSKGEQGFEQKNYDKVRIIAINPFVDLALLKIEDAGQPLEHVYLGNAAELEAGRQCFAIGNPLGLTRTVSQGIVSTTNRNFDGRLYIQTTTDINPGNSGGPLFNLQGEVIGVTSMGYIFLGGLNFAIPVDVVKDFIRNRDAFAYDEDNPNAGFRYLQPSERVQTSQAPTGRLPKIQFDSRAADGR